MHDLHREINTTVEPVASGLLAAQMMALVGEVASPLDALMAALATQAAALAARVRAGMPAPRVAWRAFTMATTRGDH